MARGNQLRTLGHRNTTGALQQAKGDPGSLVPATAQFHRATGFVLPRHRQAALPNNLGKLLVVVVIQVQNDPESVDQRADKSIGIGRAPTSVKFATGMD